MAGDDLTLAPSRSHADVSSGRGSAVATDRRRTVSIGVAVPVGEAARESADMEQTP
jgi:hypothetical protein